MRDVVSILVLFAVTWIGVVPRALAVTPPGATDASPAAVLPEKLVSKSARSEEEQDRISAAAWFAQARVQQQRNELAGALRAYERAWRYDPRAAVALQEIIPLALELGREDEAARYAVIAAEQVPKDPILVRRLALFLTDRREWPAAVRLYEKSLEIQGNPEGKIDDLGSALVQFEMGRLYFLSGKHEQSAAAFARVRDALSSPDSPLGETAKRTVLGKPEETWNVLAESFLAAGRNDDAAAMFERANEAQPNKPLFAVRMARVDQARKNKDAALAKLEEYFASQETSAGTEPYAILSKLLTVDVEDVRAARGKVIVRLKELQAADPKNAPLAHYLADELFDAGELAEAEKFYNESLARRPQGETYERLVEIYRRQGDAEKLLAVAGRVAARSASLDMIEGAAEAVAKDAAVLEKLIEAARKLKAEPAETRPPGAVLTAGLLTLRAGKLDTADEFFAAALAEQKPEKGEVLLKWGLGMLVAGEHGRSAKALQQIADEKLLPNRLPAVHYFLAGALEMSGKTEEALASSRRAIELDPSNPLYASRLAWILYHSRRLEEARLAYEELLKKHDGDHKNASVREVLHDVRLALSSIAVKQGDFAGGVEWIEQVLDEYPDDAGALNDLGYLWAERGQHLQRALKMIEKAVAAEPENASYRDSLGWAYYQLGRYDEAVRELTKAAEGSDSPGVIWEHLGDAHLKAGDAAKARAAWQKAAKAFDKEGDQERKLQVQKKVGS